jgi:mannose-6-phosphate isomerase-like protein (cupin superfamily)
MTARTSRISRNLFTSACALGLTSFALVACGHGTGARSPDSSASAAAGRSSAPSSSAAPAIPIAAGADTALQPLASSSVSGGGIQLFSAATIARAADALAQGSTTGRTFASYPGFHYVESRRSTSGSPEVHDEWIDVIVIQAGRATLLTGGRVQGGAITAPGEHRGGTIVGGSEQPVGAGDLVTVPVGVPHQYRLAPGDAIRYLTIKVRRSPGR